MPTKIEWAEESLNVVTGCTEASPGCANCYARKMSKRLIAMGQEKYAGTVDAQGRWTGVVRFHPDVLDVPAKWRKPRVVFLNSMSDTFHKDVTRSQIFMMLDAVAGYPEHTFIIATKRASRAMIEINYFCDRWLSGKPIPNLWLLVSVENQAMADRRIPHLLETNVVVRGLSMEPLLGKVNINDYLRPALSYPASSHSGLNWVIVGGESGPNARPMHPDWARSIRTQCVSGGVPFFFKQWGEFAPYGFVSGIEVPDGKYLPKKYMWWSDHVKSFRVGKKKAGRLLDGREWNEYPRFDTGGKEPLYLAPEGVDDA